MGKQSHQYIFSYKALPSAFRSDTERFFYYLEEDKLDFLQFWWDHVGERLEPEERRIAYNMSFQIREHSNGARTALITPPPPQKHGEAYFVALLYPPQKPTLFIWKKFCKVFSLSQIIKEDGRKETIFGEWTPRGRYLPGEEGLAIDLDVFYKKVLEALGYESEG